MGTVGWTQVRVWPRIVACPTSSKSFKLTRRGYQAFSNVAVPLLAPLGLFNGTLDPLHEALVVETSPLNHTGRISGSFGDSESPRLVTCSQDTCFVDHIASLSDVT